MEEKGQGRKGGGVGRKRNKSASLKTLRVSWGWAQREDPQKQRMLTIAEMGDEKENRKT